MKSKVRGAKASRSRHSVGSSLLVVVAGCVAMIGGLVVGSSASAAVVSHVSTPPCTVNVTTGTGSVSGGLISSVTAGSTKITFDCNISSTSSLNPQFVAEGSLLSAIGTTSVQQAAEADTTPATFTASSTDTGCPAGVAGQCTIAVFTVPSSFSASDPQAQCPPTQAQINDGLYACEIAVASTTLAPVAGAEYLVTYDTQATQPTSPSIVVSPSSGLPGSTIKVSDGTTGHWWADAVQETQAAFESANPQAPPTTCASTGGYGSVPTGTLFVNWIAQGTTLSIAGTATGVTISNDCYDGKTLYAPVLGGTITVPSSLKLGTTYTAYLCEANFTNYASNDANAAGDCGTGLGGRNWVDASFAFTASLAPIVQSAPLSATTAPGTVSSTQLVVTGNTGNVSFVESSPAVVGLSVSPTGLVTSTTTLAAGTYTISGTDSDPAGDSGTWTFTLGVGTTQAALTVTSVTGDLGSTLALTTSGGSGTGAVSFAVTNGTASGCAVSGTSLTDTSTGTCIVTATKAADSTYLSTSSTATTVTFVVGNGTLKLLTPRASVASTATVLPLSFHCSVATCRGTVSLTVTVRGRFSSGGVVVTRKIDIASVGVTQSVNTNKVLKFRLTGSYVAYLRLNASRATAVAVVVVKYQDKSSTIGRVSLLK